MSIWIGILLIASIGFGVIYILLGLEANGHLNEKASNTDRSIGWLFWWSFSKHKYDEEGKRLCAQGQLLAVVLLALFVAWHLIFLKN